MFRGPKLPKTQCRLNASAMLVERKDILPIDAPICAPRHNQPATTTPTLTHGANSIPVAAKQNYAHGKVNHVTAEEAQDVVIGMFFIIDTFAVALFHSGASHSFISATYVEKHNLPLALLKCQMIVSSLGGDMSTRQLCPMVNLKTRG
jgi:hypothetical protein